MSLPFGSAVKSAVVNAAFPSRTVDTTLLGKVDFQNTTESTDKDTGAVTVQGGVGIEKNLNVGGNVVVTGDLTVQGASTVFNTATLEVEDTNIVINNGGNDATSEGSGITVERTGTNGSLVYENALASKFKAGSLGSESEIMTVGTAQTVSGIKTFSATPLLKTALDIEDPGVGTNKITVQAPTLAGSYSLTLPPDDGVSGQFLKTDGLGVTTWDNVTISPLTTKGDLYTYSTVDARLPVGTDGSTLFSDSTQTTGLKWNTKTDAFDLLAPTTTKGDLIVNNGTDNIRVAVGTDNYVLTADSAQASGIAWKVGGSGSGGKNYFNAEQSAGNTTTGFNSYLDAAGLKPVDGTGGVASGNLTLAVSAVSPLSGLNSLTLAKTGAVSTQGEGKSIDFTLDASDKGKVLAFSMNYSVSGTYVDDDQIVYFYDVTNGLLLEPAPFKIKNHTLSGERFFAELQTPSNCSTLRMIFHTSSASAANYTLKFDDLVFGPQAKLYGSVATDWDLFTPVVVGASTAGTPTFSTARGYKRRVGDTMEIMIDMVVNAANSAAGHPVLTIPDSLSADASKAQSALNLAFGEFYSNSATKYRRATSAFLSSATTVQLSLRDDTDASATPTWGTSDAIRAHYFVPITGWSSSQLLSSETDTRVVAAVLGASSATTALTVPGTYYKIALDTATNDSHGGFSNADDRYTIKVPGYYMIVGSITAAVGSTERLAASIRKNNTGIAFNQAAGNVDGNSSSTVSTLAYLIAGDYIELFGSQDSAGAVNTIAGVSVTYLHIHRLSGPAQIAASESVNARYSSAAGQALTNSFAQVDFGTKVFDSHNAVTTGSSWKFTAPVSGVYSVKPYLQTGTYTGVVAATVQVELYKNGASVSRFDTFMSLTTGTHVAALKGGDLIQLLAGDYIDVRIIKDASLTVSLAASAATVYVNITRVGNY